MTKDIPKPNETRNQRMLRLRREGLTLSQIGKRMGVSHQRVRQILGAEGATIPAQRILCAVCQRFLGKSSGPTKAPRKHVAYCLRCLAETPDVPFGIRVKSFRLHCGLTQRQLAERIGVGTVWLTRLETNNKTNVMWSSFVKFVRYFGPEFAKL